LSAPSDELSSILRQLRRDAGLSGMEAAKRAGFSQPKISRFETGRQVPTTDEVRTLCTVYRARPDSRRDLLRLAKDLRQQTTKARTVLSHGAGRMQRRIGRLEAASAVIRGFHPALVFGLLQTENYTRALGRRDLTGDELDRHVAARVERQASLDTDREFVLVLTEGALRWHVGSPQIMAAQLDKLIDASLRTNLQLGVIPWTRPVGVQALHGFHLYDRRAVLVGTETATAIILDTQDVADYERRFEAFRELAVFADEARQVFGRLATEYRELS
jgi:transcriptional regulator with XRE-family HTH domain